MEPDVTQPDCPDSANVDGGQEEAEELILVLGLRDDDDEETDVDAQLSCSLWS